MAIALKNSRLI